jgi:two-component system response regulator AtoC
VNWSGGPTTDLALLVASPRGTVWRPLPRGEWIDVGRAIDAFVSLDDDGVSRRHLRIRCEEKKVMVEDLASKNGTTLDGRPMASRVPYEWPRGSCVVLGDTSLMLQTATPQGSIPVPSAHSVRDVRARWEALLERIAEQDVPVLILGETGTGKEVTAERVHLASPRRDGPLVKLHAASISAGLLESELFGHERGAFTGAHRTRIGLIEQAHGGTLFVDEVGELPPETQVKLLRVLEDRRVRRVGSEKDKVVDFRLIAATHRDVEDEVRAGRFRSDLYFRLATFTVRLPALRDRRPEIESLAATLLGRWATGRGVAPPIIDAPALQALIAYDWPGNIRELKSVMERSAIVSDGRVVRVDDLPLDDMRRRTSQASQSSPDIAPVRGDGLDAEREQIARALRECGGNQTRAAAALGISRRTLVYKLDAVGLPRPRPKKNAPRNER